MAVDSVKARSGMEVASLTDVGLQRENNEDSFLYWESENESEFRQKGRLAVIADGMGGYEGGQEASRLAVQTVREVYAKARSRDARTALHEAFAVAHERIQSYAAEHPEFQGMGTTCTAVAVRDRELYFAHVGDSRLYLIHKGALSRLTRDHSYVGRLVESGIVRSEDAENHPQRHILTAALGSGAEAATDVSAHPTELQDGDVLILCTDGLWGMLNEEELVAASEENVAQACISLVKLALERGGPDNITVLVLRCRY